jgi:AcrR family transcriptional regulator
MIAHVPDLPLIEDGPPPRERADAARNRLRILEAAAKLVDERGIEHVSMEDVACTAGVGTGTLYRRFGDRAGLALALLEEDTREFQDALISGPPPLGPGAPAALRLQAFGERYIDLLERHSDLIVAAGEFERDGRGPYALYATHLAILLAEAAPRLDAPLTARWLLATLGPGHYVHARRVLGWEVERLKAGWAAMVAALCASSS